MGLLYHVSYRASLLCKEEVQKYIMSCNIVMYKESLKD